MLAHKGVNRKDQLINMWKLISLGHIFNNGNYILLLVIIILDISI